jgi:L-asparaginase / beta-aspartyl-peptidase
MVWPKLCYPINAMSTAGRRSADRPLTIVVHGGAWAIPDADVPDTTAGLKAATSAGYAILAAGGSALDAVEAAVRVLERLPVFDAGVGSVLNACEEVECDALIVDGNTLASGGVIGLNNVLHPVSVARRLMETTPHALIAGTGAREFASTVAATAGECCEEADLVTPAARAEWLQKRTFVGTVEAVFAGNEGDAGASGHDTVGAVALDCTGRLAAATSTGGITMKMRGRVGDSPLIGCGAFADSAVGAASATGHGESIMKCMLSARAAGAMAPSSPASVAYAGGTAAQGCAAGAVDHMLQRVGGFGGAIVVLPSGDAGAAHTTPRMAWGYATGTFAEGGPVVLSPSDEAVGVTLRGDGLSPLKWRW